MKWLPPTTMLPAFSGAEILRLRGELARAEEMYRQASQFRSPQPGLSLLRLAQDHIDVAATAIRPALDEARERRTRSRLLPAYVEIMLAGGDQRAARAGADELSAIAVVLDAPFLHAVSHFCAGRHTAGRRRCPTGARRPPRRRRCVGPARGAVRSRAHARAHRPRRRARGDQDTASIEDAAARHTFKRLGATSDIARLEGASSPAKRAAASGLSARELDVLRLLVTGKTNRAIAGELCISEKTVAQHVSNIFNKLGLSTRAAATAYAYQHHLVYGLHRTTHFSRARILGRSPDAAVGVRLVP